MTTLCKRPLIHYQRLFWKQVDKGAADVCWLWQGRKDPKGYGRLEVQGRSRGVHCWSYIWTKGSIPQGKVVRHTCDNPPCVNPAHLIIGTHQQNTKDAFDRHRAKNSKGEPRQLLNVDWKNCSFYLSREAREKVSRLADKWGMSNSGAVELLIKSVGERKPGNGVLVAHVPKRLDGRFKITTIIKNLQDYAKLEGRRRSDAK